MATFVGKEQPLDLLPPTAFQKAIRFSGIPEITCKTTGRVIVLGTDLFYSPNCSLTPPLPPPPTRTYIRDPLKDSVEEFHQPHWWVLETGYLPFLPTNPNFHSPPFHTLFNDPIKTGPCWKRRVQMDSNDILSWNRLENTLSQLFKSFQSIYSIPQMSPIIRTSLACQNAFENPLHFATAEKRCRNWFSVWMAMVSLGMAIAQVSDGECKSDSMPLWFKTFVRHADEYMISGIWQQLGGFQDRVYSRAGVFLDLSSPQEQPTVEFFIRLGVPVWYIWGPAEESQAVKNAAYWKKYIPPTHLLQREYSNIIQAPASPYEQDRPWETFFKVRELHAETRPIPAKKPNMKVFRWEKDIGGQWSRIQVTCRMQREILCSYCSRQKKYDERTNEWDIFAAMGDPDSSEMQEEIDSWDYDERFLSSEIPSTVSEPGAGVLPLQPLPYHLRYRQHSSLMVLDPSGSEDYTPDSEHSPADVLRLFFGFVAPPPSVTVRVPFDMVSEQQVQNLALGVGCTPADEMQAYVKTPTGKYAAFFFWAMSQSPWIPPSNAMFDLAPGNPQSPRHSRRLKFLYQLPGNIYVFDFKGESTVDWKIAVRDVADVLFILRLENDMCDYSIARELLNRGMPFFTLLCLPCFIVDPLPKVLPRLRFNDYQFSLVDYDAYCRERDELLCNPRVARQALKCGGILWRLAMKRASFQDVLSGPTTATTLRHQCTSFTSGSDAFWVDDALSDSEAGILAGVYHVYTGKSTLKTYPHRPRLISESLTQVMVRK